VSEELLKNRTEKLKGLSIVISGTFEKHSRDELKELIEQNGGKNVGSISKKTNYVLAGENMGPSKLEKAEKLGHPHYFGRRFFEDAGRFVIIGTIHYICFNGNKTN
jgi:DNA ligase (NAD+)